MNHIHEPASVDPELFVHRILVHAAYLTAFDWFSEKTGRMPNVDEQAKFVVAIVRCLQRLEGWIDVSARD